MPKYKIGITEAGDAGIDLSWVDKLNSVDGAVLITKNITPDFIAEVLKHQDKIILHATVTGFGGTVIEPNVPTPCDEFIVIMSLIKDGFPQEKIVIRIDPIVPTPKGIHTAYQTMQLYMKMGFSRYRISVLDMYPHVRERFAKHNIKLPYAPDSFSANDSQMRSVDEMLYRAKIFWRCVDGSDPLRIESCAEPKLKEPIMCGCISSYDLNLLGLEDDTENDSVGYQRKNCLCYAGKVELLEHKRRCPHNCLYCYWKDE